MAALPGIAYQNRRIYWGSDSADFLRNEGCELPSRLFEENAAYDVIFYACTNDENDTSISRTAHGHLHFCPSTEKGHVEDEYMEDGDLQRTIVTKPAERGKSYAAAIDMPRDSVGPDLSDEMLGRHLELILKGFTAEFVMDDFDFSTELQRNRCRVHGKFLLLNRDDEDATNLAKWTEDSDYVYDVVEADVQVFGKRIPLFLDCNAPTFFSTTDDENESVKGESSESQQDSSDESDDDEIENGADNELMTDEENEEDVARERMESFRNIETWWASRHFPTLPDSVLYNIRCFCTPPPAFFLEQGDLWIQLQWSDEDATTFVARRLRT